MPNTSNNNSQQANKRRWGGCGCIFTLVLLALSLWLIFTITTPTCSIEDFNVFALTKTTTSASAHRHNNTIHYDLKLKNRNFNKGIYYDALNLTFYYKHNSANGDPIGNDTFSHFYQGQRKSTHRVGDIEATGVKWGNVTKPAVFRVELATSVRYKHLFWKTRRHLLVVGADLKVNDEGSLVKKKDDKGIKLTSNAKKNSMGVFKLFGMLCILILNHYF